MIGARIRYYNPSVNWSKFSKPWDVIFDYPSEGIVQFVVAALPTELPKSPPPGTAPKLHSFFPTHEPLADNYPHCEIRTLKEGQFVENGKLPELVKKEFRQMMSDRSVVLWQPQI
jgi:hypothetical protein